jgi:FkbM family methyltransferase
MNNLKNTTQDGHYKFIDIGCSHFSVSTDLFGTDVKGIYVEPIKEYLDCLPEGDEIIKECCAITNADGEIELNAIIAKDPVYFSSKQMSKIISNKEKRLEFLKKYGGSGQSNVINAYVKTYTSSVQKKKILVPTLSMESFLKKHNVTSVDYLKIDVEGYEENLLEQLIPIIERGELEINKQLKFEYNQLSNMENLSKLTNKICDKFDFVANYVKKDWDLDMVLTKI